MEAQDEKGRKVEEGQAGRGQEQALVLAERG
jgi:hypothetical protein